MPVRSRDLTADPKERANLQVGIRLAVRRYHAPEAPLTFVAGSNLSNIARITDEAVERIGKALRA